MDPLEETKDWRNGLQASSPQSWGHGQQRMREWLEKPGTLNPNSHSSFPLKAQGKPSLRQHNKVSPYPNWASRHTDGCYQRRSELCSCLWGGLTSGVWETQPTSPPLYIFKKPWNSQQTKPWRITQHPQMQREDGRGGRRPSLRLFSSLSNHSDSPHIREKKMKRCVGVNTSTRRRGPFCPSMLQLGQDLVSGGKVRNKL